MSLSASDDMSNTVGLKKLLKNTVLVSNCILHKYSQQYKNILLSYSINKKKST